MLQSLFLPSEVLQSLSVKTLFYPCAGDDWRTVVSLFVPAITRFWFVDIGYRRLRQKRPATGVPADLTRIGQVSIKEVECQDVAGDRYYRGMSPFIHTEQFRHRASENPIEINWYMRRGPSALRCLNSPIGIFFYRRDSRGGSGTEWLVATKSRGQFGDVLARLVDGGFVITDGSNPGGSKSNRYAAFSQFVSNRSIVPRDAAAAAMPFEDSLGNQFTCVGCIDRPSNSHGRPDLIWQLTRSGSTIG